MKKDTIPEEKRSRSQGDITTGKPPSKIARVLTYMINDGNVQHFEAECLLGDHCLHSTVSSAANGHDLKLLRQLERVPNHWGEPCTVIRYIIPAHERRRASAVLETLCSPLKQRQQVAA